MTREKEWLVTGQIEEREGTKKTTGVGIDSFHPRVFLDFSDETRQKVADF